MKKLLFILWLAIAVPICAPCVHATVAVNDARVTATGNGATVAFPYDFKILDASHINVYVAGALRTLTTHFSVSGVGAANGGTVTFVTAPASGAQVLFLRNVPLSQLSTYIPNEAFPSARIERDFDKVWMAVQQLNEVTGRSLRIPITSDPLALTPEAQRCIGWNDPGTSLINVPCGGTGTGTGGSAPGGVDGNLQYRVSGTTLGGISGATTSGTGVTFSDSNLRAVQPIFDTSFKMAAGGTDRVVFALPSSNVVQIGGIGNSQTTALHLNPGSGTIPTGTITEFVLHRTNLQAFGGNYGRWSFTALGSDAGNISGIGGEFGGSVAPTPFVFSNTVESPAGTFTPTEFMRFQTVGIGEAAPLGSVAFGANADNITQINRIVLAKQTLVTNGSRDSDAILWEGKAYDGTSRAVWWRQFNDVTSNAGASQFVLQQNLNSGGWTTRLAVTDAGLVNVPALTASLGICTDANKNLVSCTAGLSGLTPNFALRATGTGSATTSTQIRDDGATVTIGSGTTLWSMDMSSAPSGVTTAIKFPASATPVIVAGIADPGSDGLVVKYISTAGVQVRAAGGGGGGGDMLLGTSQTVTAAKTFTDQALIAVNPKFNAILDTGGATMLSLVPTVSGNSGFQFTGGTTAAPTVSLAAYGTPADINFSIAPKGAGLYCIGPCPIGQATGIQYVGSLIVDGATSGHITIAGAAAAGTYNFNLPTTAGTSGQVLTSGGGAGAAMTWATVTGTGTVTSVGLTYVGGIFSIAGATPITGSGTFAITAAMTSGGIIYGSSATTIASSGALTAGMPVLGGGAGASPTSGTRTGNTTEFGTWTGAKTVDKQVTVDASGNLKVSAYDVGTATAAGDVTAASAFGVTRSVIVANGTGKGVIASSATIDTSGNLSIAGGLALNGVTNPCTTGTAACIFMAQGTPPTGLGTGGVSIIAPATVTPYLMTLPSAAPAGDRLIQVNAAGQWSFVTVGSGVGDALQANPLSQFAATTSAQLAGVLSDEVGTSGGFVRSGGINSSLLAGSNVDLGSASAQFRALYLLSSTVDTNGAVANFYHSRAGGVITTGDGLGRLNFWGHDGTDYAGPMARINVVSTGTIGSNRVPTTMVFSTATNASPSVLTTALTLGSDQSATFAGAVVAPTANVAKLSNLNTNGCVTTSGSDGTLGVAACGGGGLTGVSSDGVTLKFIYDGNSGGGVYPRGILCDSADATAHSCHVGGRKSRGTRGSPAAVQANDYTGAFVAEAYDGFGNYPMTGFISWVVKGTPTSGVVDSYALINAGMVDLLKVEGVYNTYTKISPVLGDLNLVGASGFVGIGADSIGATDTLLSVKKNTGSTGFTYLANFSNTVDSSFRIGISNTGESDKRAVIGGTISGVSLVLQTAGTERMRVGSTGLVTIESLKTTGSASSKKVVCVDTATGILYASSTGTDCSN